MKAHNVRGTGVSKSRQICPCLKDISVFSKQEADISPTTTQQLKADTTAFLQSKNMLQFSLNYLHFPDFQGGNYFPFINTSRGQTLHFVILAPKHHNT